MLSHRFDGRNGLYLENAQQYIMLHIEVWRLSVFSVLLLSKTFASKAAQKPAWKVAKMSPSPSVDKEVSFDDSKLSVDPHANRGDVPPSLLADERNPFFIRDLEYTPKEESTIIKILDRRLFPWILLTTFVLNMDRCVFP